MIHCEKGHENPDGALFCKDCGLGLENSTFLSVINYQPFWGRLSVPTQIPLYFFLMFIIIILIYYGGDLDHLFNNEIALVFVSSIAVITIAVMIYFFIKLDRGRKKFQLKMMLKDAKKAFLQFALSENRKDQNGERYRVKLKNENSLIIYDSTYKARFYLSMDKNLNTIIIGERDPTIELIRKVLGSQLDFVEN